ncbi:diaminopropionate ammonia-lyase [Pseudomonas sp. Fl5BN2]|uniref:diaminopropionate ammonia-lyase n=1 Tax=unclassified Pseudomonas TaxID=196821 RepID=UPI001377D7D6|nr:MULTISPECIES: diaminopropionate ammonia-lyase [unclassified Pseudomonas]NBF06848.1 diaminopropionate ammonia-lyase [Pseudomonas sp. Fl5BN2]NBF10016.1 diaminopropionate ammonia-lyase [Pseudomonas sp. Fl4BN1]
MLFANPRAVRETYPAHLRCLLNIQQARQSREWLAHWPLLNQQPTPLYPLPDLARQLGLAEVWIKDEAQRSCLGSFKALGAPFALLRQVIQYWPHQPLSARGLLLGRHRALLKDYTVISASDGNHGRALAAAAQSLGCRCVIVLHAGVSLERELAIAAYDAHIVRIRGNYAQSVVEAARLAATYDWQVIADTGSLEAPSVPLDVMQGYASLVAEVLEQSASQPEQPGFSHVLVQGGVGGLAASVASYLWEYHGAARPRLLVVEPQQADCLYQSARAQQPSRASGTADSLIAGLACGEASPLAWLFLQPSIDSFVTIPDSAALDAMRHLAAGSKHDRPLVAGESGAAGLAGLKQLGKALALRRATRLTHHSRVLLINTEGATDARLYQHWVGETAQAVTRRRQGWRPSVASPADA